MEGNPETAFFLGDYDYHLPTEYIAQVPSCRRGASRLLVLDRSSRDLAHRCFEDIRHYLRKGDVLVLNDTRVVPARLKGRKDTGGRIELLVLDPYKEPELGRKEGYICLVKAAKPTRAGSVVTLENGLRAEVLTTAEEGKTRVRFPNSLPLLDLLAEVGEVPLPPYIQRDREGGECPRLDDAAAYQTVYAARPGAVAAPTAGLHFSRELLEELEAMGVEPVGVTLHVGYGTFSPVRVEDIREHRIHSEYAEISPEAAGRIESARREGRRIVAVGTTAVRTLEWAGTLSPNGKVSAFSGACDHYIYPGYRFTVVDAMITNFHLPKSTLLFLVSAFAGRETILNAYREAVRTGYRFFSYGDAMLIL